MESSISVQSKSLLCKLICHFKSFKGCLPQILLGPFLKTLPHISGEKKIFGVIVDCQGASKEQWKIYTGFVNTVLKLRIKLKLIRYNTLDESVFVCTMFMDLSKDILFAIG